MMRSAHAREMKAQWNLGLEARLVIANPIAAEHALPRATVERPTQQALDEARAQGIAGPALTPFLLARIDALTGGDSLRGNVELVLANARLAAAIAVAYAAVARRIVVGLSGPEEVLMMWPGFVWTAIALPAIAFAQAPCECKDVDDLVNRLNMAHAAIDKYQSEIDNASSPEGMGTSTVDGKPKSGKGNNRGVLQKSIDEAMGEVARLKRAVGTGETSGVTCKPEVKAGTACLKAVLEAHEAVHVKACNAERLRRKLGTFDDRMAGMLLTAYAKEEITGYQTEIDEIVERLRSMKPACRPSGWVGTIQAFEVKQLKSTLVTPRQAQYDSEKTRTMDDWRARRGAIYQDGKTSSAYWHIEHAATHTDEASSLVGCIGGAMPRPPDRTETGTADKTSSGTGFGTDVPEVDIDVTVDGLYYTLSFYLPEVEGEYEAKDASARTGGCQNETWEVKAKGKWTFPKSDGLTFKGRVDPKARYIGGSDVYDFIPYAVQIPGITKNEHTVRVTWHLHKID
jgi:hypothetical protein